jgi:hypothetical protein
VFYKEYPKRLLCRYGRIMNPDIIFIFERWLIMNQKQKAGDAYEGVK